MRFEWDPEKARINTVKHGVSFELARRVWDDPLYTIIADRIVAGEQRWHAIGVINATVTLAVVHSYPDPGDEDRVRIIGARKATSHERRRYEQEGA
ncbi:BrnT family toxin [Vineibacter terrae]|uniref:BrnT family toxin n=1 Tax=Vineibacter terrae TaxID=2586908 RepID=UPI002E338376|nr:BrnT family toxin [Vineibacter terrae]HEX2890640.1 BrnT family toxin [Vineibacter terrae]